MKKILLILTGFLVLASCSNSANHSADNSTNNSENSITETASNSRKTESIGFDKMLNSVSKKITDTQEFNSCIKTYINSCAQTTAEDLARKSGNVDFCQEIADETGKSGCQLGVILSNSDANRTPDLCEIISDSSIKNACQENIIIEKLYANDNVAGCDQIFALYKENPERAQESKNRCIANIATASKNPKPELCNAISDQSMKSSCQEAMKIMISNQNKTSTPLAQ